MGRKDGEADLGHKSGEENAGPGGNEARISSPPSPHLLLLMMVGSNRLLGSGDQVRLLLDT